MESYCERSKAAPPTFTEASPDRQISAVSCPPLLNATLGSDPFSRMRPYDKCRLVLFDGVTEIRRPRCWLVFRNTICEFIRPILPHPPVWRGRPRPRGATTSLESRFGSRFCEYVHPSQTTEPG